MVSLTEFDKFHFAVALNNGGVALLESGEIGRGLALLQESSALCCDAVRKLNDDHTHPIESSSISIDTKVHEPQDESCHTILDSNDHRTEHDWQHEKDSDPRTSLDATNSPYTSLSHLHYIEKMASKCNIRGFVDWKALKFNGHLLLFPQLSSFAMLRCVVSFNLALCHQFLGMCWSHDKKPSSRRQFLIMAAKGYELAHQMMVLVPELHCDIWMLLMIMNNRFRVLAALGDKRRAGLCARRLLSILMYVKDHEEIEMSQPMYSQYLSNVCHLILRKKVTAAAA